MLLKALVITLLIAATTLGGDTSIADIDLQVVIRS